MGPRQYNERVADREEPPAEEPQVRVVDRRWWAQNENAGTTDRDERRGRKPTYVEELEQRLADTASQLQTYLSEHRRALEDFEQARVRVRREASREVDRHKRALLTELLDVVDNLDRAIASAPDRSSSLFRGVELVRNQFLGKLEALGVARLDAVGQPFDANRHEAVSTEPVSDEVQEGIVLRVVKEGYTIGDELLRPAAVIVGARVGARG
jgi:molecular chaperone GrpE